MDPATLRHLWHHLASSLTVAGHQPSRTLVLVTGLLAVAAVASRRVWPLSRTVVTMAHEGGHALVALLTGRRLAGVRLFHNAAGVTVSAGYSGGPAVVFTALAGYLSAPLLGLGAAALLATGHLLIGGARPVLELQRGRRRRPGDSNDADHLARLTGVPGSLWVGAFGLVALGALALGAWWLLR